MIIEQPPLSAYLRDERVRLIIIMKARGFSLQQVADVFQISKSRVSQILEKANIKEGGESK